MSENESDFDYEFYTGCDEDCADDCMTDHQGES